MRMSAGRSVSVCGRSAELGKRQESAGRIVFPCEIDNAEVAGTKGLLIRLKPKKTYRVNSVIRQRTASSSHSSLVQTPIPMQYRAVFPVFPPKKSRHSSKPSFPVDSQPRYAFPSLHSAAYSHSGKGLLARRLIKTREKAGKSNSPRLSREIHSLLHLEEGPMVVVPLTPVLSSKESSRLMTEEDYSNPSVLARFRPTRENRRVIYARRKQSTEWAALYSSLNCNYSP